MTRRRRRRRRAPKEKPLLFDGRHYTKRVSAFIASFVLFAKRTPFLGSAYTTGTVNQAYRIFPLVIFIFTIYCTKQNVLNALLLLTLLSYKELVWDGLFLKRPARRRINKMYVSLIGLKYDKHRFILTCNYYDLK